MYLDKLIREMESFLVLCSSFLVGLEDRELLANDPFSKHPSPAWGKVLPYFVVLEVQGLEEVHMYSCTCTLHVDGGAC